MNASRIRGVFFRYYFNIKDFSQLSDLFYWPLVDILLWGLTSLWIQKQTEVSNLPLILMTALIFWQITWRGSLSISFNLLQEFWHRNLVNLFSTPLTVSEWICGSLILGACKLLISVAFGGMMVYILYSLNVFALGWAFLPFAMLLFIFGWTIGFLSSAMIIYWGHKVEMFAWMLPFLFAPFSAVFYPIQVLPAWAQTISWSLPTTYVFEGMRQILHGHAFPQSFFWISLLLNVLFLALSILLFRMMFLKSLKKGLGRLE
ncbi:MAG: ABC transporter permease [Verrucomicrobia bacterium]|nr:ABC transporter permease [Verrucomicrobiota bacterium]